MLQYVTLTSQLHRSKGKLSALLGHLALPALQSQNQSRTSMNLRRRGANFYQQLSESEKMPSVLSTVPGYCDQYIPKSESGCLPKPLNGLFQGEFLELSNTKLLEECEEIFTNLNVSDEQAKAVEESTKGQCNVKLWFQHRAGCITASKFKDAVHTDVTQPSQSLIKRICYPESCRVVAEST